MGYYDSFNNKVDVYLFCKMIMRRESILALFCKMKIKKKWPDYDISKNSKNIVAVESCTRKAETDIFL